MGYLNMKKTLFIFALAAFIVGCSENSAGVSAGSSSSNSAESGSILAKVKSIAVGEEAAKTIQVPAFSLIAEAFTDRVPGHMNDSTRMEDAHLNNPSDFESLRKEYGNLFDVWRDNRQLMEKEIDPKTNTKFYSYFEEAKSRDDLINRLLRIKLERRIAACVSPQNGWEYNPMNKDAAIYMRSVANSCDFANVIFTELAGKIGNRALNDPDAAKQDIQKNWDEISLDVLEAAWKSVADKNAGSSFSANLTGVKGIQFMGQGGVYWNQGSGFVVTKNSSKWFGDGALSGKVIDLNLRSSLSTKTEKSKSQSSSQVQQSGSKTGAEIGVK